MESEFQGRPKLLRKLAAVSLILNVLLGFFVVAVYWQTVSLNEQNQDLSRQVFTLKQDYDMTLSKLKYYQQEAEYYSKLLKVGTAAGEAIGQASINIVAVRAVSQGLESSYEGVTMQAEVELSHGEGRLLINTQPRIG